MNKAYKKLINRLLDEVNAARSKARNLFVNDEEHLLLQRYILTKEDTFLWKNPDSNHLGCFMGHDIFLYVPQLSDRNAQYCTNNEDDDEEYRDGYGES